MSLKELPPCSFRLGNYGASLPPEIYGDDNTFLNWLKVQNILGYSKIPEFKINPGCVAVLIEDTDSYGKTWEGWSHIPEHIFNRLLIN